MGRKNSLKKLTRRMIENNVHPLAPGVAGICRRMGMSDRTMKRGMRRKLENLYPEFKAQRLAREDEARRAAADRRYRALAIAQQPIITTERKPEPAAVPAPDGEPVTP